MNNLGQYYYFGIGTKVDKAKAFKWHLAAAKAGNPIAAGNVRLAYQRGDGVEKNLDTAKQWEAVDFINTSPLDLKEPILERTLLDGAYVPKNELSALREAAANNNKSAWLYTSKNKGEAFKEVTGE